MALAPSAPPSAPISAPSISAFRCQPCSCFLAPPNAAVTARREDAPAAAPATIAEPMTTAIPGVVATKAAMANCAPIRTAAPVAAPRRSAGALSFAKAKMVLAYFHSSRTEGGWCGCGCARGGIGRGVPAENGGAEAVGCVCGPTFCGAGAVDMVGAGPAGAGDGVGVGATLGSRSVISGATTDSLSASAGGVTTIGPVCSSLASGAADGFTAAILATTSSSESSGA
ncbi:hypothetical protein ACVIHA_004570 [Bradyrhizobium liaoningense]